MQVWYSNAEQRLRAFISCCVAGVLKARAGTVHRAEPLMTAVGLMQTATLVTAMQDFVSALANLSLLALHKLQALAARDIDKVDFTAGCHNTPCSQVMLCSYHPGVEVLLPTL